LNKAHFPRRSPINRRRDEISELVGAISELCNPEYFKISDPYDPQLDAISSGVFSEIDELEIDLTPREELLINDPIAFRCLFERNIGIMYKPLTTEVFERDASNDQIVRAKTIFNNSPLFCKVDLSDCFVDVLNRFSFYTTLNATESNSLVSRIIEHHGPQTVGHIRKSYVSSWEDQFL